MSRKRTLNLTQTLGVNFKTTFGIVQRCIELEWAQETIGLAEANISEAAQRAKTQVLLENFTTIYKKYFYF